VLSNYYCSFYKIKSQFSKFSIELPKITVDSVSSIKEKSPSDKVRSVVADVQIKPNLKKVARLPPILKTLSEYNLEEGQRYKKD